MQIRRTPPAPSSKEGGRLLKLASVTLGVGIMSCSAPVITQSGNQGNNVFHSIVGSTGSSISSFSTSTSTNGGGILPLPSALPSPSPSPSSSPQPSNTPIPTPSGSPPGATPTPTPQPTSSPTPTPTPTPSPSPTCLPPPSGMLNWWTADGDAIDRISGNNGILQNGTSFVEGKVAQAFHFDGINDYVDTSYQGIIGSQARTIDAWLKSSSQDGQTIISYGTSAFIAPGEMFIWIVAGGAMGIGIMWL